MTQSRRRRRRRDSALLFNVNIGSAANYALSVYIHDSPPRNRLTGARD